MTDGQGGPNARWLPLREAGPRLGLAPDSIRKRIRRGKWPADRCRQDNSGMWFVLVPDVPDATPGQSNTTLPDVRADMPDPRDVLHNLALAELRTTVAELRTAVHLLERELGDVKAERDRLLAMIEGTLERLDRRLAEPPTKPARRRWWWWRRRSEG